MVIISNTVELLYSKCLFQTLKLGVCGSPYNFQLNLREKSPMEQNSSSWLQNNRRTVKSWKRDRKQQEYFWYIPKELIAIRVVARTWTSCISVSNSRCETSYRYILSFHCFAINQWYFSLVSWRNIVPNCNSNQLYWEALQKYENSLHQHKWNSSFWFISRLQWYRILMTKGWVQSPWIRRNSVKAWNVGVEVQLRDSWST